MAYTHTNDPHDAVRALAERVPVAVVTCGGQGAMAIDSTTGEEEGVPSLPVNAHDPTGAGDVFGAAFVHGTLREWPLRQRLSFANLCAALSVQYVGGSLAAPGRGGIIDLPARTRPRLHPRRAPRIRPHLRPPRPRHHSSHLRRTTPSLITSAGACPAPAV